jgi:hypothetical protein
MYQSFSEFSQSWADTGHISISVPQILVRGSSSRAWRSRAEVLASGRGCPRSPHGYTTVNQTTVILPFFQSSGRAAHPNRKGFTSTEDNHPLDALIRNVIESTSSALQPATDVP